MKEDAIVLYQISGFSFQKCGSHFAFKVSFYRPVQITALATQGRAGYDQWVKSYTLTYSEDGKKYSPYIVGGQQKV